MPVTCTGRGADLPRRQAALEKMRQADAFQIGVAVTGGKQSEALFEPLQAR